VEGAGGVRRVRTTDRTNLEGRRTKEKGKRKKEKGKKKKFDVFASDRIVLFLDGYGWSRTTHPASTTPFVQFG
jgi:hypothetical protein